MFQIKRILCPIDFSEFSEKAFQYACSLARHYGSTLLLEHVVEPIYVTSPYYSYASLGTIDAIYDDMASDALKKLNSWMARDGVKTIQMHPFVRKGFIATEILSFAQQHDADLMVMGTHGRHGLARLALGSVTEKVLRAARCPVLAVHHPRHDFVNSGDGADPVNLKKILFCTDFSENSTRALGYALSLATEYGAELNLLHVLEDLPGTADIQAVTSQVAQQIQKEIPKEWHAGLNPRFIVRTGRAYQQIALSVLEYQIDLVVMGVAGRHALDLALFGSTTHRVLQMGACPVLVVPSKAAMIGDGKGEIHVSDTNSALVEGVR